MEGEGERQGDECNFRYLIRIPGMLTLYKLLIGCISLGIEFYHYSRYELYDDSELPFLLVVTVFWILTSLKFLSGLVSRDTDEAITNTFYEVIFNLIAFMGLFVTSITFIIFAAYYTMFLLFIQPLKSEESVYYLLQWLAISLVIANSMLYLSSAIYGCCHYKEL